MTSEVWSADTVWEEPIRREYQRKKNLSLDKVTGIVSSSQESRSAISKYVSLYGHKMTIHVSHHDFWPETPLGF